MKKLLLAIFVLLLSGGCGRHMKDVRAEAYEGWNHVRAETVCAQASEHLELGQLEQAARLARDAVSLDEDYDEARLLLSKVCIEQGQYNAAAVELRHVLRQRPDCAEALYLLGVANEKIGSLKEALHNYQEVYRISGSGGFYAVLAACEVMAALDEPARARSYLRERMEDADGNAAAFELAGRLAMMEKDYSAAVSHYQLACDTDADNVAYIEALGVAQVFAGETDRAIDTLVQRSEHAESPTPAWVYTMLGDCYMASEQASQAVVSYEKACLITPDEPRVWVNLSKSFLTLGEPHKAANAAEKALSLDSECVDASLLAGYAYLQTGRTESAIEVLQQARQKHADNSTLLCVLGRAYEAGGDITEAKDCYDKAAEIDPDNKLALTLMSEYSASAP